MELRGTKRTCHSDVPDAVGRRYDGIVVSLELFAWLHAAVGLHRYVSLFVSSHRPAVAVGLAPGRAASAAGHPEGPPRTR